MRGPRGTAPGPPEPNLSGEHGGSSGLEEPSGRGSAESLGPETWAVLGGGGLKGLAHVGAWQALEEDGLDIRGIVGSSIGALVGVCLAGGMGWDELVPRALELEREDIVRVNRRAVWINGVKERSLYRGDVLRSYIEAILPVRSWEELDFPVQVNAVELGTGRTEWFGPGARTDVPPLDAVCASASLPVLYPPVHIGESHFIDGGAGDALPLRRALDLGASGIVAVDVGADEKQDAEAVVARGMVAIHQRVFSLMAGRRRRAGVAGWDGAPLLYVRPHLVGYSGFDFDAVQYFLEEGYRATRRALDSAEDASS